MIFCVGDLVGLKLGGLMQLHADISDIDINHPQFTNQNSIFSMRARGRARVQFNIVPSAYLSAGDVALIIAIDKEKHVYVVGPHGCGWTFVAVLSVL